MYPRVDVEPTATISAGYTYVHGAYFILNVNHSLIYRTFENQNQTLRIDK
jgi:hypothetical protein